MDQAQKATVNQLAVAAVYPNCNQPRKHFDQDLLNGLAQSIKASGLNQPITVVARPCHLGTHMIVAGERRWRAHGLAGLTHVDAIVKTLPLCRRRERPGETCPQTPGRDRIAQGSTGEPRVRQAIPAPSEKLGLPALHD